MPLVFFLYIQLDNKNKSKNFFSEANSLYLKDSLNRSIVKLNQSLGTYYLPKALKLKADIRFKQRRFDLSTRHYKKLINEKYESESIKIDYGHSLIKNDEFSLGMSFISKGIRSYKYNLDYVKDVVSDYIDRFQFEVRSERDLYISLAILERTPPSKFKSSFLFNRALVYYYLNMYSESIYNYTLYMDTKQTWEAYLNRGLSYYYNGEYNKSISDLKKSLTFKGVKSKGIIYNKLGESHYKLNQLNKSYYNFKMALKNGFSVSESTGSIFWHVKQKLNR